MTYDTKCKCGNKTVLNMKITESISDQICQSCNNKDMEIQHLSTNAVILKGNGWFSKGK